MAKKKTGIEDLRQLSAEELEGKLISARKTLFDTKIKRAELKDPLKLRWLRRDIARIMTVINEKKNSGGTIEKSK